MSLSPAPHGALNQKLVTKRRVQFVVALRSVLNEMLRADRTPETLAAADQIEQKLYEALGPQGQE